MLRNPNLWLFCHLGKMGQFLKNQVRAPRTSPNSMFHDSKSTASGDGSHDAAFPSWPLRVSVSWSVARGPGRPGFGATLRGPWWTHANGCVHVPLLVVTVVTVIRFSPCHVGTWKFHFVAPKCPT